MGLFNAGVIQPNVFTHEPTRAILTHYTLATQIHKDFNNFRFCGFCLHSQQNGCTVTEHFLHKFGTPQTARKIKKMSVGVGGEGGDHSHSGHSLFAFPTVVGRNQNQNLHHKPFHCSLVPYTWPLPKAVTYIIHVFSSPPPGNDLSHTQFPILTVFRNGKQPLQTTVAYY